MNRSAKRILLVLIFCAMASPAYANIGVPMVFVTVPFILVGLIPIILTEAMVLKDRLGIDFKRCCKVAAIANAISTLAGIPLTWLILVLIQMLTGGGGANGLSTPLQKFLAVTWQAPWLIPYESALYWMVPAASMFLCVPFFFASWMIEYLIARNSLNEFAAPQIKTVFFWANLLTYSVLLVLSFGWLSFAIQLH